MIPESNRKIYQVATALLTPALLRPVGLQKLFNLDSWLEVDQKSSCSFHKSNVCKKAKETTNILKSLRLSLFRIITVR